MFSVVSLKRVLKKCAFRKRVNFRKLVHNVFFPLVDFSSPLDKISLFFFGGHV